MNWIRKIFSYMLKFGKQIQKKKIDYVQITTDWNAHPVSPEIEIAINGADLQMTLFVNSYVFNNFEEGDKAIVAFRNCAEYSLNTCNDEGYFYGQYRTNPSELPWGEFYEIKNGLSRIFPQPVVELAKDRSNKRHFIFFFKDETFECLAEDYKIDFIS